MNLPPSRSLALVLFLVAASTAPSLLCAEPLDEAAAMVVCPECGLITAAIAIPGGFVAVGERGLIVHGTAGNWQQAPAPSRRMLTGVTGTGGGNLVAVGHDALIMASREPGAAWTVVRASPELDAPLLDIWIAGNGRGLAVGAYGMALATENHGLDWSPREIDPDEPHFYAIREAPDGTLFIAGEFGTVLRSRDDGATWTGWMPAGTARSSGFGPGMTDGSCSTGSKARFSKATTTARPGAVWKAGFFPPFMTPSSCQTAKRSSLVPTGRS